MNKDCSFCEHSTKPPEDDPCFKCLSTVYKRFFTPMEYSRKELHKEFANKVMEYKILKRRPKNKDEFVNSIGELKSVENKISTLFLHLLSEENTIHILEEKDGKPYIII